MKSIIPPTTFVENNDNVILTEKDAAKYIGMSRSFLRQDRMNGYRDGITRGPDFMKLGCRAIRYSKKVLDEWLTKNTVTRISR